MSMKTWATLTLLTTLPAAFPTVAQAEAVTLAPEAQGVAATKAAAADQVFGLDKVHQFHLILTVKEWNKMEPATRGGFGGFGGKASSKQPAEKTDDASSD